MSDNSLFDSSTSFLSNTHNISDIKIRYINSKAKMITKNINIYNDDTCKDVLLKLSSLQSMTTLDHIFAWYKDGEGIIPLSFSYPFVLDYPYKNKGSLDKRFINDEGNRLVVLLDRSPIHKLISEFPVKTLFYTTIHDYLQYLDLNPSKQITDDTCIDKTKFPCNQLYSGKLVKYWPMMTQNQIFNLSSMTDKTKINLERKFVKQLLFQSECVYFTNTLIQPDEFNALLFSVSNGNEDNIVHLSRLFSDIHLGDVVNLDVTIPFTKLTLEEYTSKYCKLLKDSIVVSYVNETNYVTKELLQTWFKSQVTSLSSSSLKVMDETNSMIFKLYKETNYVTLVIYSNGLSKVLFSEKSLTLTDTYIKSMIQLSNNFIKQLNKQKIFSDKPILEIDSNYEKSLQFMTFEMLYPVKNYKQGLLVQFIKNMNSFVRFNKIQETKIVCIYKRVNDYGQTISSVITSLIKSRRNLKKEEIISELEILFNLSNDEATEEYDNWESDASAKFIKGGEGGVDIVIDLMGTNVKVDITGISSYDMLGRIYQFVNFMMTYYETYLNHKKDPKKLFIKQTSENIEEQLEDQDIEQELKIQEQVELDISQVPSPKSKSTESPLELVSSSSESLEESIQRSIDSEGSADSTGRPLQIDSVESSLSGSEDFEMERLDDSDSSGGYLNKRDNYQKGGYNVKGYYLNRLKKYDNEMFKNYSNIPRKNQYAVKCGATIGRQPVAITKSDLDRYNQSGEGEGVSFSEAVNIPGRDPNIYYICPKYWDIKDERPRDPLKLDEFKDVVVDNKMSTSQKKDTDNYVLIRDEGGYWKEAGNNIERYRIELLKGSHPGGYELPCCNAPRKGANKYTKGWSVDILVEVNGKYKWKEGTVVSSTKTSVTVRQGGTIKTVPIGDVRRHKSSKTLTMSFPLDIDTYGHISQIIKQLVGQPLDFPEVPENNFGLVRQGVYRASEYGDHSFLESIAEILESTNKSSEDLINHIVSDLKQLYDKDTRIIQSIAKGGFVNKFKMDVIDFNKDERLQFMKYIKSKFSFVKKNIAKIQKNKKDKKLKPLSPTELFNLFLKKGFLKDKLLITNEVNIYSSIVQFKRFLKDKHEIMNDEYLIPVLTTIAKYKSKTFGEPIQNLSIVVFEGLSDDVIISNILGGHNNYSEAMILLYKERRHMYEPIFYRKYEEHMGIIREVDEGDYFYDQNIQLKKIHVSIQRKIDLFINETKPEYSILTIEELELILDKYNLPVVSYVYDTYCKVCYIKTDKNVLLPVVPTGIKDTMDLIYFPTIEKSNYPKYADVKYIVKKVDAETTKKYLETVSLSVINGSQTGINLLIKELILKNNVYVPLFEEVYDDKKHKEDISINESYALIDKYLGLPENFKDKRVDYLIRNEYLKSIKDLLFQKIYLVIKDKPKLLEKIHKIKYHPIMLHQHKSELIYEVLEPYVRGLVLLEETDDLTQYEKNNRVIITSIDDMGDMDKELLYYKLVKLMIEFILNYSERDYERFLQLDVNLSKLKENLNYNELLFTQKDIENDYHLEYFVRQSRYIRNYILNDEPIDHSKLVQVHRMKDNTKKKITGDFTNQYPQIIHKLFGRKLNLISYKNDEYTEAQVIHLIMNELYSDSEITLELIESLVPNFKLKESDIENITEHTFFRNIGICMITKQLTGKLQHDVIVKYHRKIDTNQLVVLYQTENALIHVKKKEGTFLIGDSKSV